MNERQEKAAMAFALWVEDNTSDILTQAGFKREVSSKEHISMMMTTARGMWRKLKLDDVAKYYARAERLGTFAKEYRL